MTIYEGRWYWAFCSVILIWGLFQRLLPVTSFINTPHCLTVLSNNSTKRKPWYDTLNWFCTCLEASIFSFKTFGEWNYLHHESLPITGCTSLYKNLNAQANLACGYLLHTPVLKCYIDPYKYSLPRRSTWPVVGLFNHTAQTDMKNETGSSYLLLLQLLHTSSQQYHE